MNTPLRAPEKDNFQERKSRVLQVILEGCAFVRRRLKIFLRSGEGGWGGTHDPNQFLVIFWWIIGGSHIDLQPSKYVGLFRTPLPMDNYQMIIELCSQTITFFLFFVCVPKRVFQG